MSENRDAWGQLPKCQPGDMPGDQAEEITRLRNRNEKLERVREAAGCLPENPTNVDRDILDCLVIEVIHALKDCEGES